MPSPPGKSVEILGTSVCFRLESVHVSGAILLPNSVSFFPGDTLHAPENNKNNDNNNTNQNVSTWRYVIAKIRLYSSETVRVFEYSMWVDKRFRTDQRSKQNVMIMLFKEVITGKNIFLHIFAFAFILNQLIIHIIFVSPDRSILEFR